MRRVSLLRPATRLAQEREPAIVAHISSGKPSLHVWATDGQDAEHTREVLIQSFEHFAGVTAEALVDSQEE